MRCALLPHPAAPPSTAVSTVEVEFLGRAGDPFNLRYCVSGRIGDLLIPAPAPPTRRDGLWDHTCFEAFLAAGGDYYEFNFSPSGAWAAYRFAGYREGRQDAREITEMGIDVRRTDDALELRVSPDIRRLAAAPRRLALSAVIEERDGTKSCWALAHPAGKPDFHHPGGFAIDLAGEIRP